MLTKTCLKAVTEFSVGTRYREAVNPCIHTLSYNIAAQKHPENNFTLMRIANCCYVIMKYTSSIQHSPQFIHSESVLMFVDSLRLPVSDSVYRQLLCTQPVLYIIYTSVHLEF